MCNAEINYGAKELSSQEQVELYNLGMLAINADIRTALDKGYEGPGVDQIMDPDDEALAIARERVAGLYVATADAPNPVRDAITEICERARAMV